MNFQFPTKVTVGFEPRDGLGMLRLFLWPSKTNPFFMAPWKVETHGDPGASAAKDTFGTLAASGVR